MLDDKPPEVSIILPTLALRERAQLLKSAIESVTSQRDVRAIPIVVVNGDRFDPDLYRDLQRLPQIVLVKEDCADLPGALKVGRSKVDTAWFSTLDDDDVLLPHAKALQVRTLLSRLDAEVVVSAGYLNDSRKDALYPPDMDSVSRDPIGSLATKNWLLPGAWLARSERVGTELFDGMPRYLECTFLAIQFALRYKTVFTPEPAVRWHAASPGGEHVSDAALLAEAGAIEKLLSLEIPARLRRNLRRKRAVALHSATDYYVSRGDAAMAWRLHRKTLMTLYGLRYLPVSLKIFYRLAQTQ